MDGIDLLQTCHTFPMGLNNLMRLSRREIESAEKAIAYVDSHFSERITPEQLSTEFCIPVKKLQQFFKKKTGLTVHNYLLRVRVDLAKQLLADEDMPIKQICKKLGFRSPSNFGEFFKKQTGLTPSQFRFRDMDASSEDAENSSEAPLN